MAMNCLTLVAVWLVALLCKREIQEFYLGHVLFEMSVKYSNADE